MKIFELNDGRKFLFQWDLNRKLTVNDNSITEVHFCYSNNGPVYARLVDTSTNPRTVDIPNELLQFYGTFKAYAYADLDGASANELEYTKAVEFFDVIAKPKPDGYNYDTTKGVWKNFNEALEALQAKDTTHDAALTALQAKDITHDGNISALQAKDTALTSQIQTINEEIDRQNKVDIYYDKRLTNLEEKISDDGLIVDDDAICIKSVPDGVCPYASVDVVGGYSKKSKNLLHFPNVTEYVHGGLSWSSKNGAITVKGTITGASYSSNSSIVCNLPIIKNRTYYRRFFDEKNGENAVKTYISVTSVSGDTFYIGSDNYQNKYTVNGDEKQIRVYFGFANSNSADVGREINTTFYPMMSIEDTDDYKVPYEPYFEGFRSAKVAEIESVGANLFPPLKEETAFGVTISKDADGVYHLSGTATENIARKYQVNLPKGTYTIKLNCSDAIGTEYGNTIYAALRNEDQSWISSIQASAGTDYTVKIYETSIYDILFVISKGVKVDGITIAPMLNKGTTSLPYRPIFHRTFPIPEEAQVENGISDTCYDYIEWVDNKTLKHIKVGCVDMGTLNWQFREDTAIYHAGLKAAKKATRDEVANLLCSKYKTTSRHELSEGCIARYYSYTDGVNVKDSTYIDVETFKIAMSGVMLYYELAEPIITDISDLFTDDNLIQVEGGGAIMAVNEYNYDVPNTITYLKKEVNQ